MCDYGGDVFGRNLDARDGSVDADAHLRKTRVEVKAEPKAEEKPEAREGKSSRSRRGGRGRSKSVKVEAKAHEGAAPEKPQPKKEQPRKEGSVVHPVKEEGAAKRSNRRRYYRGKSKNKGGQPQA